MQLEHQRDFVVLPELATAALRSRCESAFSAWLIMRAADARGAGWLTRQEAARAIVTAREVSPAQGRKILAAQADMWMEQGGRIWLRSAYRVALSLDVGRVSRVRAIPYEEFGHGVARLRGALAATVYRTDADGWPMSRAMVARLSGVDSRTVRRWDARDHHSEAVSQIRVHLAHADHLRNSVRALYGARGFYLGPGGRLFRRMADVRRARRITVGSRRVSTRLNRALRGSPLLLTARGERPRGATYFKSATAFLRTQRRRGLRQVDSGDPLFDFARDHAVIGDGFKWFAEPWRPRPEGRAFLSGSYTASRVMKNSFVIE